VQPLLLGTVLRASASMILVLEYTGRSSAFGVFGTVKKEKREREREKSHPCLFKGQYSSICMRSTRMFFFCFYRTPGVQVLYDDDDAVKLRYPGYSKPSPSAPRLQTAVTCTVDRDRCEAGRSLGFALSRTDHAEEKTKGIGQSNGISLADWPERAELHCSRDPNRLRKWY